MDTVALNGEITPLADLRLQDFLQGFYFGAGFFETILVVEGAPMFLERHCQRLRQSLEMYRGCVASPPAEVMDTSAIAHSIAACLEQSQHLGARFTGAAKLVASDGRLLLTFRTLAASHRLDSEGIVLDEDDSSTYRRGDSTLNHKSIAYLRQYRRMKAMPLFINELNQVCETPIGNVFFQIDGQVITPTLEAPCLPGVIRSVLLEQSARAGIPIIEQDVTRTEISRATSCVTTNSLRLAVPVHSVLGTPMTTSFELAKRLSEMILACQA